MQSPISTGIMAADLRRMNRFWRDQDIWYDCLLVSYGSIAKPDHGVTAAEVSHSIPTWVIPFDKSFPGFLSFTMKQVTS